MQLRHRGAAMPGTATRSRVPAIIPATATPDVTLVDTPASRPVWQPLRHVPFSSILKHDVNKLRTRSSPLVKGHKTQIVYCVCSYTSIVSPAWPAQLESTTVCTKSRPGVLGCLPSREHHSSYIQAGSS